MSGPIPFLGSKISLISKSEIRYEGILYTIDAQESIIALAKVRSFGTEDRPTEMPVPARDEVYEYIIFRGTDIKKIEVCDTPKQPTLPGGLHNDPAIVQAAPFSRQSLGPIGGSLGLSYGSYGQSITQQGIPGAGGFPMGSTSQPSELSTVGGGGGSVGSLDQPSGTAPVAVPAPIGPPPQSGAHAIHQTGLLADILVGSRSSTPTARKSPVSDAGVQVSPPPNREEKKKSSQQRQPQQERSQRNGSQVGPPRRGNMPQQQQQHQQMGHQQGQQQGQPGMHQGQGHQQHQHQHQHQHQQPQHQHQHQHYNNQYYQYQQYQGRGGAINRGRGSRRPSGQRGRGQSFNNQGNRQRQFQDRQLFEKDYDFEQANEEFEELRNQLARTKIAENGDKKDDSGHETTAGDVEDDSLICYDKTKSFFDSISCEAIERSKGKSQRPDWRLERKINVETFGVSSARRGYYPRGRGGYYRGGYYRTYNYNHGYYRGGGGYRGGRGGGSGSSGVGRGIATVTAGSGGAAPAPGAAAATVPPVAAPAPAAAAAAGGGGGGSTSGVTGLNGVSQRGGVAGGSYSSTVRNSTPTK
ncbi:protein LSM14 homolog A-like isoform X3 [Portunus trituberculatus]|uniref:protein LSM14 homolog A-like isoform X3 n=1 Tax=Portunus trituberculatus TaxID=210409 RepID=UPI001E1D0503|nr:protein LSM14 homolog A-like isoform X3 [Portunus trituberculatus]